ncbi:MAG TPA: glycosyltransferase family 39 protein [Candidatus Nanoarchaeia archaeon]|nr:glycosyltransferase family 39 protein [Candidatus Nanoarchaeia archaeon]
MLNKMSNNHYWWLAAIFILILTARLILAFTTPNFTYESYFNLRQVEHIKDTGFPQYEDSLSYGGRTLRFLPLFYYLMAFLALFLPLELVAKIAPNLLLSSLTVLVYLISYKITNNQTSSLLSAFTAGLLPILFFTGSFSIEALFLPLVFLAIYSFLRLEQKKFQYLYIVTFLGLSLTTPITVILLVGFLIYLLLSFLESKKLARSELELIFFSVIFFVWVQFLFFKDILISEGISFIWQNIPRQIIREYFPSFSVIEAIVLVSIIPFLSGIFVVYRSLFKSKNETAFFLISLAISTSILGWLRLIRFNLSLAFFAIILSILFSIFYGDLYDFISRTKWSSLRKNLAAALAFLLSISTIFSTVNVAVSQETPSEADVEAFKWLSEHLPEEARVLALLDEGHLITYYGRRKNLADDQFSLIKDAEELFVNLNSLFTTTLQTHAVDLFDKYGLTHIMFTERAKQRLGKNNFQYLTAECYERLYEGGVKIYKIKCTLKENV